MPMEKFSSQAEPHILQEIKGLAKAEGKQLQALVNEALMDLIEKRKQSRPRRHVLEHFQASLAEYGPLYEKLAQ